MEFDLSKIVFILMSYVFNNALNIQLKIKSGFCIIVGFFLEIACLYISFLLNQLKKCCNHFNRYLLNCKLKLWSDKEKLIIIRLPFFVRAVFLLSIK